MKETANIWSHHPNIWIQSLANPERGTDSVDCDDDLIMLLIMMMSLVMVVMMKVLSAMTVKLVRVILLVVLVMLAMLAVVMMMKVLRAMMVKQAPLEWFYEGSTALHNWLKTLRAG